MTGSPPATNVNRPGGGRLYPAVAAGVMVFSLLASAAGGALGALIYGTSDDRAFAYLILPAGASCLVGWAVLLGVYLWSRRRATPAGSGIWLTVAAVALPFIVQAAAGLAFTVSGNFHHYPDCPPQHLGAC